MAIERGKQIKVLDNGYVALIDSMGTDEGIIEAARMSTGRGFEGWDDRNECTKCGALDYIAHKGMDCEHQFKKITGDQNLLDFMYRNGHMTPFEMCELQIEVQAPIFVFREWHRHRTQSYNEFSARYSVMPNNHYVPALDRFMPKMSGNKQESSIGLKIAESHAFEVMRERVGTEQNDIYTRYEVMLGEGVPKEVARVNTPVSRYSKMRAKTDLRNWLAFCTLRMRPNAQWEIRQYAEVVGQIIKQLWPRTWALFEEYELYAVKFGRSEMEALHWLMNETSHASKYGVEVENLDFHTPETVQKFVEDSSFELGGSQRKEFINKLLNGGKKII